MSRQKAARTTVTNPMAEQRDDLEAGPPEPEPDDGTRVADVGVVRLQLKLLAKLHSGEGLSVLAYAGYAVLLVCWFTIHAKKSGT